MTYDDVQGMIDELVDELLSDCEYVTPTAVGLDARAGGLWVCEDYVVSDNVAGLEYYGGFEYVTDKKVIGSHTVYFATDERVSNVIDRYFDSKNDDDDDDDDDDKPGHTLSIKE